MFERENIIYYLFSTKESIIDFKIRGGFRDIKTSNGDNITLLQDKIICINGMKDKELRKFLFDRIGE